MNGTWISVGYGIKLILYVDTVTAFTGFHAFERTLVWAVGTLDPTWSYFVMISFTAPFPERIFGRKS
jgi:hypothetical protein